MSVAGEIVSTRATFKPEDRLTYGSWSAIVLPAMSKVIVGGSRPREAGRSLVIARCVAFGLLAVGLLAHCASEPSPPPAAPSPEPVPAAPGPAPAPAPAPPAAETAAANEPAPERTEPPPAPEPEATGPTRPAGEVITEGDTDFLLDDSASALKEAVRQKCEAEVGEGADPKALADCRQKAREKFTGDVLSFQASEAGSVTLVIYRRKGPRLDEVYRAAVVLKDQNPTTVLVTPKGGKGARPFLYAQREFTVHVPDNYSLVIEDPTLGKLVYRAKVGLVARQ